MGAEHDEDRVGDAARALDVDRLGVGNLGAKAGREIGRRLLARRQREDEAPAAAYLEPDFLRAAVEPETDSPPPSP